MTVTGPAIAPLAHPITAKWIVREGWRLDAAPFLSGKVEALQALEKLPTQRLVELTHGYEGGIFRRPQHNRHWVTDPQYGVPYIGSSDMLLADLSRLPLLLRSYAESKRLSCLRLSEGMTLISASGTIGRTVYCRSEMNGMWGSEDVMKVVPDPGKVPPGYLFAFLKCRYGAPLVISGTYGAIIQHIEPEHLRDIPIPRLEDVDEDTIHQRIILAGNLRAKASELKAEAISEIFSAFCWPRISARSIQKGSISETGRIENLRFDALFYNPTSSVSVDALRDARLNPRRLDSVARVFTPGIFKRRYVPDPQYGHPYFSGSEMFEITPECRGYLKKDGLDDYLVTANWLLIQDAGQLDGLIGQTVRVPASCDRAVVSNHMIRVAPIEQKDAGYLFALLTSDVGYCAMLRNAFGTSIPQLDPVYIGEMSVPWPAQGVRWAIASKMDRAWSMIDQAHALESESISQLETKIRKLSGVE